MKEKISIYICDDEPSFLEIIEKELANTMREYGREYKSKAFPDAKELIKELEQNAADAVLLDIDMPEMTGFDAAERLQAVNPKIKIIFITGHEDKVFQSYEYHPFWFVRKSCLSDMQKVIKSLLECIDTEYSEENGTAELITENKLCKLKTNEVMYITAYKHYIRIVSESGESEQLRCRISDAEEQLNKAHFIRVQNGIIVNARFVKKLTSKTVLLTNGEEFNVSRDRSENVRSAYQRYVRSV